MIDLLSDITLRWRLRKYGHEKKATPPTWDVIKRVALVLNSSAGVNKNEVDAFLESMGKYVEVFYIEPESRKPTYYDWQCFTEKDFNFLNLPKKHVLRDMKKKQFDLVINASYQKDRFATLLAAAIPAGLHCASSGRYREAELVISPTGTQGITDYLTQVLRYLQMIRV